MTALRLDSKVIVVTGAGRGLGREHALALAARGATLVVNDLGAGLDGHGMSSRPADEVVERITGAGGTAIADYGDVATEEGANALIERTEREFGRLDGVVNNAGTYHLAALPEVSVAAFADLVNVHLMGTLLVTRAGWPLLKKSTTGRVVNTISEAFLGYRHQGSYGAAKGSIFSLTRVMAVEGADDGIKANCIVPAVASRMGALYAEHNGIPLDAVGPENLPPAPATSVATYLLHPSCEISGQTLSINGGTLTRWEVVQTQGHPYGPEITPEDVAAAIPQVVELGGARARELGL